MIHYTAIIDTDQDNIGKGAKVWAFSHICENAVIGNDCFIGEGVYIGPNVKIGDGCRIQNHSLIYEGVELENEVFIGPNTVTTNDIFPSVDTENWRENRFRTTLFKKGCRIGANVTIVCGTTIGEGSLIGAGSVVTKDMPSNIVAYGNPAKIQREV